jgi:hypothetical protein
MVNTKITYEAGTTQIKTTDRIWTEFSCKESLVNTTTVHLLSLHKKKINSEEKEAKPGLSDTTRIKRTNMSIQYYVMIFTGKVKLQAQPTN